MLSILLRQSHRTLGLKGLCFYTGNHPTICNFNSLTKLETQRLHRPDNPQVWLSVDS